MSWAIKFRPIKLGSPHLNEKIERSQRTDLDELWSTVNFSALDLPKQLTGWEDYYNWEKPHRSLGSMTPGEKHQSLYS